MTQPSKKPAGGFNDPFGMMQACHERLSRMPALVERLRTHVARQAERDVMRHFGQYKIPRDLSRREPEPVQSSYPPSNSSVLASGSPP